MRRELDILIVKLSALGDVVQGLAIVSPLKASFPGSKIHWLVEKPYAAIVACHKDVDEVIAWDRGSLGSGVWHRGKRDTFSNGHLELVRALRKGYDLAIDIQGLLKSGVWMGLARARRKIGFRDPRERWNRFFTKEKYERASMGTHAVEHYLGIISALGGRVHKRPTYGISLPREALFKAKGLLGAVGWKQGEPLAVLVTGARWDSKKWESWGFSQVADRLSIGLGLRPVFVGTTWEKAQVREIVAQMKSRALDLTGTTDLPTLASVMRLARVVVSTDSGPLHVAVAVGTPVVALFGPTAPWRTGPYGEAHSVVRVPMQCSPCFRRRCARRACMRSITPSDVIREVERVIQQVPRIEESSMEAGAGK